MESHPSEIQKPENRIKRIIFCIILLTVIIEAGIFIIHFVQLREYNDSLTEKEQVFEILRKDENNINADANTNNTIISPSHDFMEAWQINKDVIAFVTVPGTKVDYPILQNEKDDYYLMRNLDLSKGYPGCIYTNSVNSKDFSDPLTVIYGHNMKNKTMFGSLHEYDDTDFINDHKSFTIETPEKLFTYDIIAVANYTDDNITYYFNPKDKSSAVDFMASVKENIKGKSPSYIDDSASINEEDKLAVLSTCFGRTKNRRFLLIGKLTSETPFENPVSR